MKTFRTILLIAGILVAGLALNTSFAQEVRRDKDKSHKQELKEDKKAYPKVKNKSHKYEAKEQRKYEQKSEMKAQKSIYKNEQKMKVKAEKQKLKSE